MCLSKPVIVTGKNEGPSLLSNCSFYPHYKTVMLYSIRIHGLHHELFAVKYSLLGHLSLILNFSLIKKIIMLKDCLIYDIWASLFTVIINTAVL
jgi:hypothetical protein